MKMGRTLTELKNKIITTIINDEQLIKALIIKDESFLTVTPTPEQQIILDSPESLIRQQIMPYKNTTLSTNKDFAYITSSWVNFKKVSEVYKNGKVYFYIIIPNSIEKTDYGIRYDFIADRLESILFDMNHIGEFVFDERGDISIDSNYLGHYITFEILDFYGW